MRFQAEPASKSFLISGRPRFFKVPLFFHRGESRLRHAYRLETLRVRLFPRTETGKHRIQPGIGKQVTDTVSVSSQRATRVRITADIYSPIALRAFCPPGSRSPVPGQSFFSRESARQSSQTSLPPLLPAPDVAAPPTTRFLFMPRDAIKANGIVNGGARAALAFVPAT